MRWPQWPQLPEPPAAPDLELSSLPGLPEPPGLPPIRQLFTEEARALYSTRYQEEQEAAALKAERRKKSGWLSLVDPGLDGALSVVREVEGALSIVDD